VAQVKVKKEVGANVGGPHESGSHTLPPGLLLEQRGPLNRLPFDASAMLLAKSPRANLLEAQTRSVGTIEIGEADGRRTWFELDGSVRGLLRGQPISAGDALYAAALALTSDPTALRMLTGATLRKLVAQTSAKILDALKKRPGNEADRAMAGGISLLLQAGILHRHKQPALLEHAIDVTLRCLARAKSAGLVDHYLGLLETQAELLSLGQRRNVRDLSKVRGLTPDAASGPRSAPYPAAWS
jgi:hypothetical protein